MTKQPPPTEPGADEHLSTVQVLHQHSLGPSRKEKVIIPIVLLAIAAVLLGAGVVIWDHMDRGYTKVGKVAQIVTQGQQPVAEQTGLAALLQPDDSRYMALEVRTWDFWVGKGAVTQGFFIHVPDLKKESIEALVRGERSAASLLFRFDLSRTDGNRYHVDEIYRGGMPTDEANLTAEIYPLKLANRPAESSAGIGESYMQSDGVAYDREGTFARMKRFVAQGRLQKSGESFWIQGSRFSVDLAPGLEPGLRALLQNLANTTVSEKAKFFLNFETMYPWSEAGKPGRRQTDRVIGTARLDGVLLGNLYAQNTS